MKRVWYIFVLFLVIASLLAPMPVLCSQAHQTSHSCCASQAQLSAPSCCQSDASPKTAVPAQTGGQVGCELVLASLPESFVITAQPVLLRLDRNLPSPILLPATILRT
jgi:hypothetical protein